MRYTRVIIFVFVLTAVTAGIAGWLLYSHYVKANNIARKQPFEFFIHTGTDYETVVDMLEDSVVKDIESFKWLADKMNYPARVYPGRYIIQPPMSNRELITLLRSGQQVPIRLVTSKYRTKPELVSYVSKMLEADSSKLMRLLDDEEYLSRWDLNPDNVMCLFIPNTYEFYWNTDENKFIERMHIEFDKFWNDTRRAKAAQLGLKPEEVIILASIVEEESQQKSERPTIAGLYLNRLRKGMKLQADPTVKFALQNFGIRRVLRADTQFDSPYNTYMHEGLPPGPICTPSVNAIESVLNAEKHEYLFMCAKVDAPGFHAFAKTNKQHMENARKFQQWLNEQNIYR